MEELKRASSLNGHAQSGLEPTQGKLSTEQNNIAIQKTALLSGGGAATKEVTPKEAASKEATVKEVHRQAKQAKDETKKTDPIQQKGRSKRSVWTVIGCIVLLIAAISGVMVYIAQNARNVTLYQVGTQKNVPQFVGGGGITYPHQQFDLSYAYAERVVSVLVKAGDHVNANQPLIKLDPTQLNAQINQAANDVAAARSYLYSISGSGNAVTIAAAQQQLQVAENHYNSLVAQTSSDTLKNGNLVAPFSGTVTAVNINPGEVFGANAVLLTIMDQSTVTIRAKIPLSNLRQVKVGMATTVTPSALPDVNLPGIVSSIVQQADPQTDTVEVWVEVKNTDQTLLPGMSAFARIQGQINAFAVPRLAVLNPDHNSVVFIERGNKVYQQTVHVASRGADVVYVDQGLANGDKIVLIPLDKMHDGQQVVVSQVEH